MGLPDQKTHSKPVLL